MKYEGKLNKKIRIGKQGLLDAELDEWLASEGKRIGNERRAKLPDLFKAHGIEDGDWPGLALALAMAHVPGFQVARAPGRPAIWNKIHKAGFRYMVDDTMKARPGLTTAQAIRQVIKLDYWADKCAGMKPLALRKHYDTADKDFAVFFASGSRQAKDFDGLFVTKIRRD